MSIRDKGESIVKYIFSFMSYIFKHSSGLDTVEYLSHVHHNDICQEK